MATKRILIRPVISEKAERLSNKLEQYTFVVTKTSNKIEVKNAIEQMYGVTVESVNTMLMPGKEKSRTTKSGVIRGRVASFKKAIVTLAKGESIDLYGEI